MSQGMKGDLRAPKRVSKHVAFHDEQLEQQESNANGNPNPQDATLKKANSTSSRQQTRRPATAHQRNSRGNRNPMGSAHKWKHHKRGRLVRVAVVENADCPSPPFMTSSFPPLPGNQYTTTLRRRAIRKLGDQQGTKHLGDHDTGLDHDETGDISLGMKLSVVGGRVIVQTLNALSDGRASPAQLAGVIQRGDVLLAIGNLSLVNLPVDQLMEGLKPLSAPGTDGTYERLLQLRFEVSDGLKLLKAHEESQFLPANEDGANDMFPLFPMVDQLSGAPLFEDTASRPVRLTPPPKPVEEKTMDNDYKLEDEQKLVALANARPDTVISEVISKERTHELERCTSNFFNWKPELPSLLREADSSQGGEDAAASTSMTRSDRIEMGTTVMKLVKSLTMRMEDVDRGKDMRSFKTWSANFSLRSGASARRRHILDAASLRSLRGQEIEASFDESAESLDSASFEDVDGDALLLGLAAHDGIWRKQVIDALNHSIEQMKTETVEEEDEEAEPVPPDIDTALTKELGSFLFGENISRIITKKKKSNALPPEEITTVLFDLTTHIATSAPDEITVFGGISQNPSFTSGFGTFGKQKASQRADMLLANRFILDQALPRWLLTFRPLPLSQRRVLWPRAHSPSDGGGTNTLASDGDSLTVESLGSAPKSPGRAKNLREMIEDQALDVETRAETCFLVTYYFTQELLGQYSGLPPDKGKTDLDANVVSFVKQFGAYLQLHSCLSSSAIVRAEAPILELLKVAAHDPSHRDAVREIQKGSSLTFYDTSKLSALLSFLVAIRHEPKSEKRKFLRNLCVSAYPDIQPWQVRLACLGEVSEALAQGEYRDLCSPNSMRELYYGYLSMLLDPLEGHDSARHDSELVKEWCAFSLGFYSNGELIQIGETKAGHKNNFLSVASRVSSDHLAYKRDLPVLLELSMKVNERELALDLLGEILDSRALTSNQGIQNRVRECLRQLGHDSLQLANEIATEKAGFNTLKRVLLLFHRMSNSQIQSCRESSLVANEIHSLLDAWESILNPRTRDSQILTLIDFVVNESPPRDVLLSLVLWSSTPRVGDLLYSRINSLLRSGVCRALRQEMSGSLLRLKHARGAFSDENKVVLGSRATSHHKENTIWGKLSVGSLHIEK